VVSEPLPLVVRARASGTAVADICCPQMSSAVHTTAVKPLTGVVHLNA
jgi:hypothetical protein